MEPIPSWTDYFLSVALVTATRSPDQQTKVGAVMVDDNNHIISTGYNGFPRGMPDKILPKTRPKKYDYIVHAESNCLVNSTKSPWDIKRPTMYLTMRPCFECLKLMINSNIKEIYAIDREVSETTLKNKDLFELFLKEAKIKFVLVKPSFVPKDNIFCSK